MKKLIRKPWHILMVLAAFVLLNLFVTTPPSRAADDELDAFIKSKMTQSKVPGLAACIIKDGEVVWAKGYGWANIQQKVPVTVNTLFMLASVSKTITGTALMHLYEDGDFKLSDPVNKYLPFAVKNPNYPNNAINFRHLLTHTSGLLDNWDIYEDFYVDGDSPIALGTFLKNYLVRGGKWYDADANFLDRAPGKKYEYTNVGFGLIGYLVERISGLSFNEYCKKHLFLPLEMKETSWFLRDLNASHIATPYEYNTSKKQYQAFKHYGFPDYPSGQLRTSVKQLANFLIAHMNFGKFKDTRILKEATVEMMQTIQYPSVAPDQGLVFFYEDFEDMELLGHDGDDTGATNRMFFRPEDNVGVIVLTNGVPNTDAQLEAYLEIYGRLFEEADDLP